MYSIKNRKELEKINELVSLNKQVDELRSQDKLDKQNFHWSLKKYINSLLIQVKTPQIKKIDDVNF